MTNYYAIYHPEKDTYLANCISCNQHELKPLLTKQTRIVSISKNLYEFLQTESQTGANWIDLTNYHPEPITLSFATLEINPEKLTRKDKIWKELQEEIPEFKNRPNDDALRFQPYTPISKEKHTHFEWDDNDRPWYSKPNKTITNHILEEDDPNLDFTGIYLTHLNGNHDIESLTHHHEIRGCASKNQLYISGVSDNASQVIRYIERCLRDYQYGNTQTHNDFFEGRELPKYIEEFKDQPLEFVILMTPIVNHHDPKNWGGWRWHKWGEYIGQFKPQCEYLDHEDGIDFVFVWNLVPVLKTEKKD